MFSASRRFVSVLIVLFCSAALAQTSPGAYIHVSSNYSGSNNRTAGFVAKAERQLSPVPCAPWSNNIICMAVNGTYLRGSDNVPGDNGRNIYTYRIHSNVLEVCGGNQYPKEFLR